MTQSYPKAQKLLEDGKRLLASRAFDDAMKAFKKAAELSPDSAEAHFQIGRLYLEAFRGNEAIPSLARAAELRPNEPMAWRAWAEALALSDQIDAIPHFQSALKSAPIDPRLRVQLQDRFGARRKASRPNTGGADRQSISKLVSLIRANRYAEAEKRALSILKAHPKSAVVANLLAEARARLGNAAAAEASYRHAIKIDPLYTEAYANLGLALLNAGRTEAAVKELSRAVILAPDMVSARVGLATGLNRLNKHSSSIPLLQRAVELDSKDARAYAELGNARLKCGDDTGAFEAYVRSIELTKGDVAPGLRVSTAQLQMKFGKEAEAKENLEHVLQADPEYAPAISTMASRMQTEGEFDKANELFERALELDPTNGETYRIYLASRKVKDGDPILAKMLALWETDRLTDHHRMNLGFAIAKALEEVGDDARVFTYLNKASALMRSLHRFDIEDNEREIRIMSGAYGDFDYKAAFNPDREAPAPIFVTGLPRSGTTLVEQIIASHSTMSSGGELGWASLFAKQLVVGKHGVRHLADVPDSEFDGVAQEYATRQAERFPEAVRITDKSISTYRHIGPLKLAMPQARFIVVRRDPRDNLFSMYKNKFPDGTHNYTYDMKDLADYYGGFLRILDFWRERVPDWFYEVQYEELVANPEEEARKLIEACGLEWEDACLNFHQNRNKVQTLSVYQVRQPISQKSVKGWKRFEKDLAPMIDALREAGHVTD